MNEINSTLMFYSNFSIKDMDFMTWRECEDHYAFYMKNESDKMDMFFKMFAIRNVESTNIAQYGKDSDIKKYIRDLTKTNEIQENDIEEQFEGVDFG